MKICLAHWIKQLQVPNWMRHRFFSLMFITKRERVHACNQVIKCANNGPIKPVLKQWNAQDKLLMESKTLEWNINHSFNKVCGWTCKGTRFDLLGKFSRAKCKMTFVTTGRVLCVFNFAWVSFCYGFLVITTVYLGTYISKSILIFILLCV